MTTPPQGQGQICLLVPIEIKVALLHAARDRGVPQVQILIAALRRELGLEEEPK